MLPHQIRETSELIKRLPGIGPRQALRCAFYILRHPQDREDLKRALGMLDNVGNCAVCFRAISITPNSIDKKCSLCGDGKRIKNALCIVEEDVDIEQLEKSGAFKGLYFVLGGRFSLSQDPRRLNTEALKTRLTSDNTITEIILALSPTAEGNATALWLKQMIADATPHDVQVTRLGIGIPSGAEIEYADEETLKGALEHRS